MTQLVEMADGRVAHWDATTNRWHTVSDEDGRLLQEYLAVDPTTGYSRWCADTLSEVMDPDWEP
jgi:hypothetical protein